MSSTLSPAAHAAVVRGLTALMEEISETAYCAGWMTGLEYDVWRALEAGHPRPYGQIIIDQEQVDLLRELSTLIDGWVTFEHGYVPMGRWLVLVDEQMAGTA